MFNPDTVDVKRFNRMLQQPPAQVRYVIHFTPRSGSSWLTDVCAKTGRLGEPGEFFNPNFVPNVAQAMQAANLRQMVQALVRRKNIGGVFGCEITYYQLKKTFQNETTFDQLLGGARMMFLIREDILLQTVSLAKMVQTQVSHSPQLAAGAVEQADKKFVYDTAELTHWLKHIHDAEKASELLFKRYGYNPMRMTYEELTTIPVVDVVNKIARYIGEPSFDRFEGDVAHTKIGTDRNQAFADRFREENRTLVEEIEDERKSRLPKREAAVPVA